MVSNVPVVIVAGMGKSTRVIGNNNELLWHIPDDLKRFKALTTGKPIIMGRKTFESILAILGKPLPNRTNIVVTRQTDYTTPDGVLVAPSLDEAFTLALTEQPSEIHIGGGAELYRQALPMVDRLYLTHFHDDAGGDTTFPEYEHLFTEVNRSPLHTYEGISYEWVDYERI